VADAMAPLAEAWHGGAFLGWMTRARPNRSATARSRAALLGLSMAMPFDEARAGAGDPALRDAIVAGPSRGSSADSMYPARMGDVGTTVSRPALTGAALMPGSCRPNEFGRMASILCTGSSGGRTGTCSTQADGGDPAGGSGGGASSRAARLKGLKATQGHGVEADRGHLPAGDPRIEPAAGTPHPARRQGGAALVLGRCLCKGTTSWALAGRLPPFCVESSPGGQPPRD